MEKIRLSKLMAERGLCSRREADRYIERGWVFVNGERITTLGTRVDPTQSIRLDPKAHSEQEQLITIVLNKPVGYVSGQPEGRYPPAVSLVKPDNQFSGDRSGRRFRREHLRGLAPAGRLDIDSQGLLILTADGRLARQLIGQDSTVEKEYLVRIQGEVTEQKLARLRHGLELDGRALKPAGVTRLNEDQLQFVLREGRKRQIRRMCELVGLQAIGLKRVRIGRLRLGNLPEGQWRYLGADEKV